MFEHLLVASLILISVPISRSQFVWKTHLKRDNRTIEIPMKYLKMEEPKTTFTTKKNNLSHSFDEKCKGGMGLGVGFQVYTPYVDLGFNPNTKNIVLSGIFPNVVAELLRYCCPRSEVEYASFIASINDLGEFHQYKIYANCIFLHTFLIRFE